MIFVLKGKKQVKKCTHICKGEGVIAPPPKKNRKMFVKSLRHCDFCCKSEEQVNKKHQYVITCVRGDLDPHHPKK